MTCCGKKCKKNPFLVGDACVTVSWFMRSCGRKIKYKFVPVDGNDQKK